MRHIYLVFLLSLVLSAQTPYWPSYVTGQSVLLSNANRSAWNPAGTEIAYDVESANGYFNLYLMNANGTGSTCLTCAGAAGVGVLQTVTVSSGTDNSLPNSGTWTTSGGSGSGANGTFTASGGNLVSVTITSGGTRYTSSPTFVPNSGSLGTSTVYFPTLPLLEVGNPHWSPDGNYIAFEAEDGPSLGGALADYADFPGSGYNCDLWVTDAAGHFWQLTNQGSQSGQGGVIYPTFNFAGTLLAWGQRLSATPTWGSWEIAVATWSETGGPSISNTQYYKPIPTGGNAYYYEPHGWAQDNKTLFFMGNLDSGMEPVAMNIYAFNTQTQALTHITTGTNQWNEFPTTIPSGSVYNDRLVYMSTTGTNWSGAQGGTGYSHFECDLWSNNYSGTNPVQLTFFNTPGSPYYDPAGICLCDPSWNSSTSQLLLYDNQGAVYNGGRNLPNGMTLGQMWLLNVAVISTYASPGTILYPGAVLR